MIFVVIVPYSRFLERLQREEELGEATIGDVDTGGFILNLMLLCGFRGLAANYHWTRSIELQKAHDWDELKNSIDLITKLQPHFLAAWTFQSWNLAYNVSVEWDAPEDKYEWIKSGIKFVQEGVQKNRKSPDLVWDTAFYYFHKIGFSDEAVILRRIFFDDKDSDFKRNREGEVASDNFELAGDWFQRAVNMVDAGEARLAAGMEKQIEYVDAPVQKKGRPGDLHFRTMPAHAVTRFASALEKESMKGIAATFGARARDAWTRGENAWMEFGKYEFPAPNSPEKIRIGAFESPKEMEKLSDNRKYWTRRWADQVNYMYWLDKCRAEAEPQGVESRRLFYEATKSLKAANYPDSAEKYESGLRTYADLLKRHPNYADDYLNKRDTGLIVRRAIRAMKNAGLEPPADLPLKDLEKMAEKETAIDPFDALEVFPYEPETREAAAQKPR